MFSATAATTEDDREISRATPMAFAELWLRHARGMSIRDLARDADMPEEGMGLAFALLAEMLEAAMTGEDVPSLPPALLASLRVTPDMARDLLILMFVAWKPLTEIDAVMGGPVGIAGAVVTLLAETIRSDLRAAGLPVSSVEILQRMYDDAQRGGPVRH